MRPLIASFVVLAIAIASPSTARADELSHWEGFHQVDGIKKGHVLMTRLRFNLHRAPVTVGHFRKFATGATELRGTVQRCKFVPSLDHPTLLELCHEEHDEAVVRLDNAGAATAFLVQHRTIVQLNPSTGKFDTSFQTTEEAIGTMHEGWIDFTSSGTPGIGWE